MRTECRKQAGLTQKRLASGAGLNPAALRDLERGVQQACLGTVIKLSGTLGVPVDTLTEGIELQPEVRAQIEDLCDDDDFIKRLLEFGEDKEGIDDLGALPVLRPVDDDGSDASESS